MTVDVKELQKKLQEIQKLPREEQAKAAEELSEEEIEFLQKQSSSGEKGQCIFCRIANHEIPAKVVYEDDFVMAFLDANPSALGHTLVIPKEHYDVLPQIPPDRAALIINVVRILTGAIFEAAEAQGVNVLQNNGAVAGQAVPHVHFHIIPRHEGDKLKIDRPPPIKLEETQFDEMQKRIIEKAKSKAEKKVVYDISGKPIDIAETKVSAEPRGEAATGRKKKEKLLKIKPRIP
ncbi:MAG: HIT family protein [archaeon]